MPLLSLSLTLPPHIPHDDHAFSSRPRLINGSFTAGSHGNLSACAFSSTQCEVLKFHVLRWTPIFFRTFHRQRSKQAGVMVPAEGIMAQAWDRDEQRPVQRLTDAIWAQFAKDERVCKRGC